MSLRKSAAVRLRKNKRQAKKKYIQLCQHEIRDSIGVFALFKLCQSIGKGVNIHKYCSWFPTKFAVIPVNIDMMKRKI